MKKMSIFLGWAVSTGLIALLLFLHVSHTVTFQHLRCTVGEDQCPDYVIAEFDQVKGKSLFSPVIEKTALSISAHAPSFQLVQFSRHFPDTITAEYRYAQLKYILETSTASGSAHWVIDEAGVVVTDQIQDSLPRVEVPAEYFQQLSLRATLDPKFHASLLDVFSAGEETKIVPTQITLLPDQEAEMEVEGITVRFLLAESKKAFFQLHQILRSRENITLKEPIRFIDLRFKYPILKTTLN